MQLQREVQTVDTAQVRLRMLLKERRRLILEDTPLLLPLIESKDAEIQMWRDKIKNASDAQLLVFVDQKTNPSNTEELPYENLALTPYRRLLDMERLVHSYTLNPEGLEGMQSLVLFKCKAVQVQYEQDLFVRLKYELDSRKEECSVAEEALQYVLRCVLGVRDCLAGPHEAMTGGTLACKGEESLRRHLITLCRCLRRMGAHIEDKEWDRCMVEAQEHRDSYRELFKQLLDALDTLHPSARKHIMADALAPYNCDAHVYLKECYRQRHQTGSPNTQEWLATCKGFHEEELWSAIFDFAVKSPFVKTQKCPETLENDLDSLTREGLRIGHLAKWRTAYAFVQRLRGAKHGEKMACLWAHIDSEFERILQWGKDFSIHVVQRWASTVQPSLAALVVPLLNAALLPEAPEVMQTLEQLRGEYLAFMRGGVPPNYGTGQWASILRHLKAVATLNLAVHRSTYERFLA
jgi:hypothetical protein